ncbi:MAG: RimK family alpha-L-glutamate ligase [Fimbriimonadaceae bacterium]|nr:RimK family alpha-L-glutamate ligase [Fimbriimonadaceae bacterium]QYK56969.1 MAG: RimK family alpha-L-glutamate ligase [Fimbriimonadaceae bacterium]
MKVVILSRAPRLYSTRRLREAARGRGHQVQVLDTLKFSLLLETGEPDLFYRGRRMHMVDAVIPRIGASVTQFGVSVVRQFMQMGVFVANTANAVTNSRDKLRSLQILSRYDIGIAPTSFVRGRDDILPAIQRVGGAPVIIKLLEGTQGVGVILAETQKVAEAIIETMQGAKQNVIVQKFVAESKGKDVRALVVGDQVVAAMRRVAQGTEFRANIHRGGMAEPVELDAPFRETAVRAAQILGLRVAGVDMLESAEGPQVIEVNSSPGLQGIERTTGVDVAGCIVDYVEQQVLFPELDVRERLTVTSGYGVAELVVSKDSTYEGKTIHESGLREQDVVVLTLEHEGTTIPNPSRNHALIAGDRLLCFGRLDAMKDMVPRRKKRRVKKQNSPAG